MLKRLGISFCLLLAFAMLQAHNFTPHHHHEQAHESQHHHGHEHDNGNDKADHNLPFTDLTHNAEFGKIITKPHFDNDIPGKPILSEVILVQLYDRLASVKILPRPHPPDDDSSLHVIFVSHSLPLRAPPALIYLS